MPPISATGRTDVTVPALRPAEPRDLEAVLAIIRDEALLVDGIVEGFGEGWIVAELEGKVVGCAAVETYGQHGLLRSVATAPATRGTGLGRRLVESRQAWARERGLATLSLLTLDAAAFFRHLGYREIERREIPEAIHGSVEYAHGACAAARAFLRELR